MSPIYHRFSQISSLSTCSVESSAGLRYDHPHDIVAATQKYVTVHLVPPSQLDDRPPGSPPFPPPSFTAPSVASTFYQIFECYLYCSFSSFFFLDIIFGQVREPSYYNTFKVNGKETNNICMVVKVGTVIVEELESVIKPHGL
ncbi:unnamed protein product [Lactuca saligna]|uniref:Uncharacterized protein n=1 Tax=Lactuca saligna TaxID=75948 RepID=A0AA36EMG3_LACSI|nr:unnamed protein product [Lactuca saligna]